MGFYNVQKGDAPYFKNLADNYAMSDNFHQSVNGGTGANHIMLGHGDAIWFSDGNGTRRSAAAQRRGRGRNGQRRVSWMKSKIRIPRPAPTTGTPKMATAAARSAQPSYGGGSYTNCSDPTQPGVAPIVNYLQSLPRPIDPNCEARPLLPAEQLQPGLLRRRQQRLHRHQRQQHRVHHSAVLVRSIGDALLAANISWKYYGDQWNNYVPDPYQLNYGAVGATSDEYCNICNPFQYDTSIMANAAVRTAHIQDTANLYTDIPTARCRRFPSSSPAGWSTAIRPPRSWISSKASRRRSSTRCKANPHSVEGHRDLHHLRRRRRLLRLRLRSAARLLRRRHAHPDDRGVALHQGRTHLARLLRSRLDSEVHRAELESGAGDAAQPRQLPQPDREQGNPYVPVNTPAISDLFDLFDFGGHQHGY